MSTPIIVGLVILFQSPTVKEGLNQQWFDDPS
jgi:hypothetical protein